MLVVILRSPVVGGSAAHVMSKVTCAVAPAGTEAVCGFALVTVQLDATPLISTE